jgi:hypothetical protein
MSKEEDASIYAQEQVLKLRLDLRPKTPLETYNRSGECLYCGETIGHYRRWCNDDMENGKVVFSCRDSYVKEQKQREL